MDSEPCLSSCRWEDRAPALVRCGVCGSPEHQQVRHPYPAAWCLGAAEPDVAGLSFVIPDGLDWIAYDWCGVAMGGGEPCHHP